MAVLFDLMVVSLLGVIDVHGVLAACSARLGLFGVLGVLGLNINLYYIIYYVIILYSLVW